MSMRAGESSVLRGVVAGTVAYALGVGLVVATGITESHPPHELWGRSSGIGHLLVHQAAHLPVWQSTLQWAMLPYTLVLAVVLVGAGFVVARGTEAESVRVGTSIAVGYAPLALVASIALVVSHEAVTAVRMVAPTVLVGVFVPTLFGGLGGVVATRVRAERD